jgi:hypothetical protein
MIINLTKYVVTLLGTGVLANTAFSNPIAIFSQEVPAVVQEVEPDSSFDAPSNIINFNVYGQNEVIYCNFKTGFKCKSYAIEGKSDLGEEFKSLFYCNDELCVDSREWVDISFANNEYPYQYFRIKTVAANGEVHYSQVRFVELKARNEVEIVNSVVSGYLYFRFNAVVAKDFSYSIAAVNGESVKNDEPASEGCADLAALPPGFYMISFRSVNGKTYRYKFLKTSNL